MAPSKKDGDVGKKAADVKSILKMQHLQNISLWAGREASMPSYAAFLGNRFATFGETSGIPLDPSLVPCQRCESLLQPGFNCTVRVEANGGAKTRRRRNRVPKNIVVYTCNFCSHRNVKKGTPKRHMKEILSSSSKHKVVLESESSSKSAIKEAHVSEVIPDPKSNVDGPLVGVSVENSPVTPKLLLLEGKKKRRRKSGLKEEGGDVTPDVEKIVGGSSRKRRKGWSSLKEIAENNNRSITNIPLPISL